MATFDRQALSDFISAKTSTVPLPFFAGREEILEDIVKVSHESWKHRKEGLDRVTRVVKGPTGSGKTSLLAELEKRQNVGRPKFGLPRVCRFTVAQLANAEMRTALTRIARVIDERNVQYFPRTLEIRTKHATLSSMEGTTGEIMHVRVGLPDALVSGALKAIRDWIRLVSDSNNLRWPIIVVVDEAQNLQPGKDNNVGKFLRGIHNAEVEMPFTLVLAGEGEIERQLVSIGIKRGFTVHNLGSLKEDETEAVMTKFCDHFGIEIGGSTTQLRSLANQTGGWPKHLHEAQVVLAQLVAEERIDGKLDRIQDWGKLHEDCQELRESK